jgi:hypothetical protein
VKSNGVSFPSHFPTLVLPRSGYLRVFSQPGLGRTPLTAVNQFRILPHVPDTVKGIEYKPPLKASLPDNFVEIILADGAIMAHPAVWVAIIVGSQASVIIDLLPGCAGRRSAESVATFTADQHALQQCRFDAEARDACSAPVVPVPGRRYLHL